MNCRISEPNLRGVCRELLLSYDRVSHRMLRKVLRERFGAAGKTARVLKVWREEAAHLAQTGCEAERQPAVLLPTNVLSFVSSRIRNAGPSRLTACVSIFAPNPITPVKFGSCRTP